MTSFNHKTAASKCGVTGTSLNTRSWTDLYVLATAKLISWSS